DDQARSAAVQALREIGPAAIPAMVASIGRVSERAEGQVHQLLHETHSETTARLLGKAFEKETRAAIRARLLHALDGVGPASLAVQPALLRALGDRDPEVRRWSIHILGSYVTVPGEVDPALERAARDPSA